MNKAPTIAGMAALAAAVCLAGCSGTLGGVKTLDPLADNGDDFGLIWETVDKDGNVLYNQFYTAILDDLNEPHAYAPIEFGIDKSGAVECGYDPATDAILDVVLSSEAAVVVQSAPLHAGVYVNLGDAADELSITVASFVVNYVDATDPSLGYYNEVSCFDVVPGELETVFLGDGVVVDSVGDGAVVRMYFIVNDFVSDEFPEGNLAAAQLIQFEPSLTDDNRDRFESITGGVLALTGEYRDEE